ncbi:PREDICTED: E3 ubiquitin-protein ligase UBR5-like [Acropora digitifera]|uniref:E3 ubiquitin-protein ligase UBR5-like n=1 Tax=Acropora digitifera TaxID=70779 RepID=UPI00077A52BF|nr:PREDICTED: E3 ubiquitin-protein ligase UBR5-like [Acropora digitifera]
MFTAIGRFIGLSLWFSNTVPLNFSRHVVKFLLEREVTWEDLAFFNADLFEGLSRMILDGAHPMMTSERFQATYCCHFETSVGGTTEELVPGGSQIPVTPENICKYVRLYATKVMIGCVEAELRAMRSGLHDIVPVELLSSLTPEDFQLLLSGGTTDVDINRLRSVISFSNSNGCSSDILNRFKRWFWSIVQKMTPLQRQQLLYFCTGSAVLPAVSDRRDPDQDLSITVEVISGNTKALPMATTCGQRMSIPLYPSKKVLKRKLLQAIQCQSYGLG